MAFRVCFFVFFSCLFFMFFTFFMFVFMFVFHVFHVFHICFHVCFHVHTACFSRVCFFMAYAIFCAHAGSVAAAHDWDEVTAD